MSVSSIFHPLQTISGASDMTETAINPRNFFFLIPTITGVALGILFLPNFSLGLAIGAIELVVQITAFGILTSKGILKKEDDKNSEYHKQIRKSLLAVCLFGPIVEEGVFRGFVQPLLTVGIQILVPAATAALFGTGLSVATAVSVVATAVIFGAVHYFNPHKNSHIQAVSCTVGGIVLGLLAVQFGIGASIAAHVANNALLGFITAFVPFPNSDLDVRPQRRVNASALPR
jgi:membrane protease YdiL (CAAX protease family)